VGIREACHCDGNGMYKSQSEDVLCVSIKHVFGPFFFAEKSIKGQAYMKMLQNWLMPQLAQKEFILL
jgi:hypothetical protein